MNRNNFPHNYPSKSQQMRSDNEQYGYHHYKTSGNYGQSTLNFTKSQYDQSLSYGNEQNLPFEMTSADVEIEEEYTKLLLKSAKLFKSKGPAQVKFIYLAGLLPRRLYFEATKKFKIEDINVEKNPSNTFLKQNALEKKQRRQFLSFSIKQFKLEGPKKVDFLRLAELLTLKDFQRAKTNHKKQSQPNTTSNSISNKTINTTSNTTIKTQINTTSEPPINTTINPINTTSNTITNPSNTLNNTTSNTTTPIQLNEFFSQLLKKEKRSFIIHSAILFKLKGPASVNFTKLSELLHSEKVEEVHSETNNSQNSKVDEVHSETNKSQNLKVDEVYSETNKSQNSKVDEVYSETNKSQNSIFDEVYSETNKSQNTSESYSTESSEKEQTKEETLEEINQFYQPLTKAELDFLELDKDPTIDSSTPRMSDYDNVKDYYSAVVKRFLTAKSYDKSDFKEYSSDQRNYVF